MKSRPITACVLFFLLATVPLAAADFDQLLVINGLGERLSRVNRVTATVTKNILTLGLAPNRIRTAAKSVLIVNSISDDLWVLNDSTYSVERVITWPDGANPWDVEPINDSLCAVSLLLQDAVSLVNFKTGDTLGRTTVGKSPEGMLKFGNALWVANTGFDFGTFLYGQGTVSVIDPRTSATFATIPVGTNPQELALAPDGAVHVLCTGNFFDREGIIYIINPQTQSVIDSIPLGGAPGDLVIAPDGMGYIAAGGFVDSGHVYRYDAISRTVLNSAANPWRSARGVLAVLPRLEGGVYAACFSADSIIEHDLNGAAVRGWEVGDGPGGIVNLTNRRPGDLSEDGVVNATDLTLLIGLVFFGGAQPERPNSADLNADCVHNATDLTLLINLVFFGGTKAYWGCAE